MAVRVSTGFAAAILGPTSFASIFNNGVIKVYSGAQPASADLAPTGTLLGAITLDGGPWVAGSPTNGLQFDLGGRYAVKPLSDVWILEGSNTGVAGWFRLLPNALDDEVTNITAPRIDGAIGLAGGSGDYQIYLGSTNITPTTSTTLASWYYAIPPL